MQKESELITEFITNNNHRAFEELVLRHQKMVYSVCFRMLKNSTDAQDATQSTLTGAKIDMIELKEKNNFFDENK